MQFNLRTDIDLARLKERAFAEALLIFNKESTCHGRTLQQVRADCLTGQAAELYLIDYCGFKNDPRPYKDVLDTEDAPIEVKVTRKKENVKYVLRDANADALELYKKYQKILYIFVVTGYINYKLHGIYNCNGKEFI